MKFYLLLFTALLSACSSTTQPPLPAEPAQTQTIPVAKKIYFFQHKLLPEWTFTTNGMFYSDLLVGELTLLRQAATEVISEDYAMAITSEVVDNGNSVLLTFPTPQKMANCYFVLIQKKDGEFRFYTYEKTLSFGDDDPVIGVVGTWSSNGNHGNLGGRTYREGMEFVKDILDVKI